MFIDMRVLQRYEFPASQMCRELGIHPYDEAICHDGMYRPAWVTYAIRMHELNLMIRMMKEFNLG